MVAPACGKRFSPDDGFGRLKAKPETVGMVMAAWALGHSYRDVEAFLALQGIKVGKSTIERWVRAKGGLLADYADAVPKPALGGTWHADETTINVNGDNFHWAWNVLDRRTRYWLASPVTRNEKSNENARKPLRKAIEVAGKRPAAVVTDGLAAYNGALNMLYRARDPTLHLVIPPIRKPGIDNMGGDGGIHPGNNIIERLQGTQRRRTKVMRGFNKIRTAQELINAQRAFYNHGRRHQGLGGLTPAEAAGVPKPVMDGQTDMVALLVAAYRQQRERAESASVGGDARAEA